MKAPCAALLLLTMSAAFANSLRDEPRLLKGKPKPKKGPISKSEVLEALDNWGKGLVSVSEAAPENRVAVATNFINSVYNYANDIVLFKPTLAVDAPFRTTFEGALSYFVGGNAAYAEDGSGFASNRWASVTFDVDDRVFPGEQALVMAYVVLKRVDESEVTVHFSMGFVRDEKTGQPFINLHHSSLPYAHAFY
jgi:hypothetical protein